MTSPTPERKERIFQDKWDDSELLIWMGIIGIAVVSFFGGLLAGGILACA